MECSLGLQFSILQWKSQCQFHWASVWVQEKPSVWNIQHRAKSLKGTSGVNIEWGGGTELFNDWQRSPSELGIPSYWDVVVQMRLAPRLIQLSPWSLLGGTV